MKHLIKKTLLSTLMCASFGAMAAQSGDMIVRAGLTHVNPDSSQTDVFLDGANSGLTVGVEDDTQLGLNFVYFVSDQLALEVLAATPFKHDIMLNDGSGETTLAETKHLPPTVSALYYLNTTDKFQPYFGIGVNYTVFFDEDFTSTYADAGFSDLDLDSSFGLAFQFGGDYYFDENWLANASVRYIDIETEANFKVGGAVNGFADVAIDPMVVSFMIGYKF